MNIRTGLLSLIACSILVVPSCFEQVRFKRLERPDPEHAQLYILRPFQDVLTWTRTGLILRRFPGKFTDKNPIQAGVYSIGDGEFFQLDLAGGYYELEIEGEPEARKILFLKNGEQFFFALRYRSRGNFSIPELFIDKMEKTEAVDELLNFDRMIQIPASSR